MKGLSLNKFSSKWARYKREAVGYVFVLPIFIGLAFIYLPSLARSVMISFSDLTFDTGGMHTTFSGFKQYDYAFRIDPNFTTTVINSLRDLAINVPTIIIFSFFIANILNQKFFGRAVARTLFFLPVIISTGILYLAEANDAIQALYAGGGKLDVGGMDNTNIFNYQQLRAFFLSSGLNSTFISLILGTIDRTYYIATTSGVQILLFLAALQTISPSHYEVAKIEGATAWEILWKITFPSISPIILVAVLYTVIETFYSFSNPMVSFINGYLRNPNDFSYGSALSMIYFAVIAVVIALLWFIINKFILYSDE